MPGLCGVMVTQKMDCGHLHLLSHEGEMHTQLIMRECHSRGAGGQSDLGCFCQGAPHV